MKSNKGITLVALVITIIVLLILAGVSISLVVGDNGIMTRAKDAGTKTNEADALESFKLAVASLTSQYFADAYTGTGVTETSVAAYISGKLKDELATMDYTSTPEQLETTPADTEKTVTIKKTGDSKGVEVNYKVSTDGNISDIKLKPKTTSP